MSSDSEFFFFSPTIFHMESELFRGLGIWLVIATRIISSLPPFCLTQSDNLNYSRTFSSLGSCFGSQCRKLSSGIPNIVLDFLYTQTPNKASFVVFPYERQMHLGWKLASHMLRKIRQSFFFFNFSLYENVHVLLSIYSDKIRWDTFLMLPINNKYMPAA